MKAGGWKLCRYQSLGSAGFSSLQCLFFQTRKGGAQGVMCRPRTAQQVRSRTRKPGTQPSGRQRVLRRGHRLWNQDPPQPPDNRTERPGPAAGPLPASILLSCRGAHPSPPGCCDNRAPCAREHPALGFPAQVRALPLMALSEQVAAE